MSICRDILLTTFFDIFVVFRHVLTTLIITNLLANCLNEALATHGVEQGIGLPETHGGYDTADDLLAVVRLDADDLEAELAGARQRGQEVLDPRPDGEHRARQDVEAARAQAHLTAARAGAVGLAVDVRALRRRLDVLLVPVEFRLGGRHLLDSGKS